MQKFFTLLSVSLLWASIAWGQVTVTPPSSDLGLDGLTDGCLLYDNSDALGCSPLTTDGTDVNIVDSGKITFGTGDDAGIFYDGTNMIVDPQIVGSGTVIFGPASAGDLLLEVRSDNNDASNYEGIQIGIDATNNDVELTASTAGTGDDDIDILLTPAGVGIVEINNAAADPTLYLSNASFRKYALTWDNPDFRIYSVLTDKFVLTIDDSTNVWTLDGTPRFIIDETDANATTSELDANDSVAMYTKANKLVFAYNNATTMTYLSIPLDGSTTTWTHSTSAP